MRTIRLLCLHGYHGSADILRRQMRPLVNGLTVPVEFVYVDAPSIALGDFGWWHLNFRGWERTRDWAVELFEREPRFDGVFGFSQGAALTALLVGMRASDGNVTEQRPLSFDFAMMASGFRSDSPMHAGLFAATDSYALPSLHMMSRSDPIVGPSDSRDLARQFQSPVVLEHDNGHVVASTPPIRAKVAEFLTEMSALVGEATAPATTGWVRGGG
jgi:pimeloyl-ACP methyl ester carboxylesterase